MTSKERMATAMAVIEKGWPLAFVRPSSVSARCMCAAMGFSLRQRPSGGSGTGIQSGRLDADGW